MSDQDSHRKLTYNSNYRGIVLDFDELERGKCRIFVPGVYPEEYRDKPEFLPDAFPTASLFGGNFEATEGSQNTQTGICGWPKAGAHVWVFFEQGNISMPIYFAACQGGEGWISDHNKQWKLQTDNVTIIFDETEGDDVDRITVKATGNVLINIIGNVKETIDGNVERTITGNLTETIQGDVSTTVEGSVTEQTNGEFTENIDGDHSEEIGGSVKVESGGTLDIKAGGNMKLEAPKIDLN